MEADKKIHADEPVSPMVVDTQTAMGITRTIYVGLTKREHYFTIALKSGKDIKEALEYADNCLKALNNEN